MTFDTSRGRKARAHASRPRGQRGVVLFIALIVMVALSLAGIALIRSTDTAMIVAGNLAFKQAAMAAVDRSVETAVHAMWDAALVPDRTADYTPQNYFACVQTITGGCIGAGSPNPSTPIPQIPDALDPAKFTLAYFTTTKGMSSSLVAADSAGNKSYYVIERMCLEAGAAGQSPPASSYCNLASPGAGANPGTQHYFGLVRHGDPFYRVTVRVDGPRNTVTYAQAILQ